MFPWRSNSISSEGDEIQCLKVNHGCTSSLILLFNWSGKSWSNIQKFANEIDINKKNKHGNIGKKCSFEDDYDRTLTIHVHFHEFKNLGEVWSTGFVANVINNEVV